jgi:hypothetical protein
MQSTDYEYKTTNDLAQRELIQMLKSDSDAENWLSRS